MARGWPLIEDSFEAGTNVNFCPPIAASTISPPLACVKTATPSLYFAVAAAPDFTATADAPAWNASWLFRNLSKAALSWNTINSANVCPPSCRPIVAWVMSA
jgi:hypothetical protein